MIKSSREKIYKNTVALYCIYAISQHACIERGIFILFLLERGLSNMEIGMLQSGLFLSTLLFEIPSGLLADRFSRKAVVISSLFFICISSLGMIAFDSITPFLVLFILHGAGLALVSGADEALLYDTLKAIKKERRYIKINSIVKALSCIALGLAMGMGGFVQEAFSWNAVYLLHGSFLIIALFSFSFIKELVPSSESSSALPQELKETRRPVLKELYKFFSKKEDKFLILLMLAMAFYEAVLNPYYIFGQQLFKEANISIQHIGLIYAASELLSALVSLQAGKIAARYSLKKIMLTTMLLSSVLIILNLINCPWFLVVLFICSMTTPDIMQIVFENFFHSEVSSEIRASTVSLSSFLNSILISIAYIAYGFLFDILYQVSKLTKQLPLKLFNFI